MALQDVCGFQETSLHPRGSFPARRDASLHFSGQGDGHLLREERHSNGAASPLHLFVPSPDLLTQNPLPFVRNRSSPLPSSSPLIEEPFLLAHGTTTLAFVFQGGVIAAADTRASCANSVACPSTEKILPVHSHMVATSSGSGADCMFWQRVLARECRLYSLRHRRRLPVGGAAKLLAHMLHPFKGTKLCVALTLCGWDEGQEEEAPGRQGHLRKEVRSTSASDLSGTEKPRAGGGEISTGPQAGGPKLYYVCSDGNLLRGDLFSVGSGSPYAYSVLDGSPTLWGLNLAEACSLAREAVFRATYRDAYSGNNVDLFHITSRGWRRREREDLREEYYRERRRKSEGHGETLCDK